MAAAERTCIVTRTVAPRDALVRLVASPGGDVIVDYRGRLPGRGAWVEPSARALQGLARRRGAIEKALGARLDPDAVAAQIRRHVEEGVLDGLSMARAAGTVVLGQDRVAAALREGRVDLVGVAADASPRTVRGLEAAGPDATFVRVPATREALGARIGRSSVAVFGVPEARPARYLAGQLRRLSSLG